ncbi:branched-chain amino acid ABC transporter permease [Xanthobacter autotrophicus]|uniref:branched-chain amino acid ABC transporter permease n=1 Tax=Xanthobacter autotrophicus TaxID=280 RepID=UPI003727B912
MNTDTFREFGFALVVIAAAAVFGAMVESGALRDGLIRLCCLGLFAASLNLLVGYTGMLSFGHAMFFGLGAYTFCILMQGGHLNIPLAAMATVIVVCVAALLVGMVCVRLSHVYFAFITLAMQMLFFSLLIAWSGLTGGEQGLIGGLPKPAFFGIDLSNPMQFFVFNVVVLVASLLILRRIVASPFGAALRMVRDNPQRAAFLGVDVPRTKLTAFVIASAFAGVAGILMSLYVSGAYPNFAYWTMSAEGLFMIMLGGIHSLLGPVVGAGLLLVIEILVNTYTHHHGLIIGLVILFVALGLRKGVLDFAAETVRHRRSGPVEAAIEAPQTAGAARRASQGGQP